MAASLMTNTTAFGRATEGKWLSARTPPKQTKRPMQAITSGSGAYAAYDLDEFNDPTDPDAKKCFAFNFFGQTPYLHFSPGQLVANAGITSAD